jgi:4-hydroxy-tetrahydrodipicolinate synthase
MFKGSIVALVTPFKDGKIDADKVKELVEFHIENGTSAIVSCGTTGESPTLSHDEDVELTKLVVKAANKRIPVIAGTGSNNTREALYLTEHAKKNGADAALVVVPYYNKPTQEGLYQHYKYLAENVDIPIILYNVPGRTVVALSPETIVRLSKIPNIVAVKDATGTVDSAMQVLRDAPDFTVLSGDDGITFPMMALGARGVISVAANIIPKQMADMCRFMLEDHGIDARRLHYQYMELFKGLFYEANPIPVKAAMHMMGMITDEIRLPLTPMSDGPKAKLKQILSDLRLI